MFTLLRKLRSDDRGISALEYALLAGMVLVAVGGALTTGNISSNLGKIFGQVTSDIGKAAKNVPAKE